VRVLGLDNAALGFDGVGHSYVEGSAAAAAPAPAPAAAGAKSSRQFNMHMQRKNSFTLNPVYSSEWLSVWTHVQHNIDAFRNPLYGLHNSPLSACDGGGGGESRLMVRSLLPAVRCETEWLALWEEAYSGDLAVNGLAQSVGSWAREKGLELALVREQARADAMLDEIDDLRAKLAAAS